jgi:HEAT repeat protein
VKRTLSRSTAARVAARDGMGRLSAALTDPDPTARMLALEAIGELDAEHAAQMIIDTLHDPDPDVRCAAAAAAVRARAAAAVFSLILALDDEEPEVREEAHLAIERITGQEIEFDPAARPATRQRRIDQLKRWWKKLRFAQLASDHKLEAR